MNLTKLVLKRPISTALIVLGIFVFGIFSFLCFDMELIPDIDLPMYLVYTVYPGASPTSIDELVTSKIEDSAETLSGVDSVISYSYNNYCMVGLTYDYDQNMNDAYTSLSAALDLISLPDDCQEPTIIEMDDLYKVQAGAFTTQDGADQTVEKLRAAGFETAKRISLYYGKASALVDGVTQEEVFSLIKDYDKKDPETKKKGIFGKQETAQSEFYQAHLRRVRKAGIEAFLLEYTRSNTLKLRIKAFCEAAGMTGCCISDDVDL